MYIYIYVYTHIYEMQPYTVAAEYVLRLLNRLDKKNQMQSVRRGYTYNAYYTYTCIIDIYIEREGKREIEREREC